MIGDIAVEPEPAEPSVRQIEVDLFALERAGVKVRYICHEHMIHHFYAMGGAIPYARTALKSAGADIAALAPIELLTWRTDTLLGGSTTSINSALQRARETLAKRYPGGQPSAAPHSAASTVNLKSKPVLIVGYCFGIGSERRLYFGFEKHHDALS
jgi:hypothetical protein